MRTASSSRQWGTSGTGPGQFGMPHCLAMDSKGNLYVGDRDNNRIQVFTQDGKFLSQFTQFSRPSGIVIDKNDILYASDSESKNKEGYGHHPGFKRGVRIGSVKNGVVTDFIPDDVVRCGIELYQRRRRHLGRRQGCGLCRRGRAEAGAEVCPEVKVRAGLNHNSIITMGGPRPAHPTLHPQSRKLDGRL